MGAVHRRQPRVVQSRRRQDRLTPQARDADPPARGSRRGPEGAKADFAGPERTDGPWMRRRGPLWRSAASIRRDGDAGGRRWADLRGELHLGRVGPAAIRVELCAKATAAVPSGRGPMERTSPRELRPLFRARASKAPLPVKMPLELFRPPSTFDAVAPQTLARAGGRSGVIGPPLRPGRV